VGETSGFEFDLAMEKLKSQKSASIDQMPVELIEAVVRTISCEIHKLTNFYFE
jgi:hypothetical protein